MTTKNLSVIVAAAFLCAHGGAAVAQVQELGDIIVTAQKRAENVNEVPIAISVMTSQDLVSEGATNTQKLELVTPGLVFGDTDGFAQPYLRGIGSDLIVAGQESPVGFYLDGVYLPFTTSLIQEFGDVARVEVLRGPQGTLYGRNTTGGAINIITRDPQQDFTSDASLSYGEHGYAKAVGYISGGITNTVSGNLSVLGAYRDGTTRVINTGEYFDNLQEAGVRGKLRYQANDDWSITVGGDFMRKPDSSGTVFSATATNNLGITPPGTGPSFTPRETYIDPFLHPYRKLTDSGLNATIKGNFSGLDLTAITGFRDDYMPIGDTDADGTTNSFLTYGSVFVSRSLTQELSLASAYPSRFQWQAGTYLLRGYASMYTDVWALETVSSPPSDVLSGSSNIHAYAAYGQASYAFTDEFKLIAGGRYSYEWRDLAQQMFNGFNLEDAAIRSAFGLPPLTASKSWNSVDPKVTFQYERDRQLLYASYSSAFKSGSYNLISLNPVGPLNPEKNKAFEVGGKHDLSVLGLPQGARLNWSAFHYKYSNIQINVKDPTVGGIVGSQNAATTVDYGFDVDATMPLAQNLYFTLGGERLISTYTSFPDASVINVYGTVLDSTCAIPAIGCVPGSGDFVSRNVSGNRAVRTPPWTATSKLNWTLPTKVGDFNSTATWYFNDGFFFDPGNRIKQGAYSQVNLDLQFIPHNTWWRVSLWATNLTNKTVLQGINETSFYVGAQYNQPRIVGVTLSAHF